MGVFEDEMPIKESIIISILLFVALLALIICEKKWPEAGSALLGIALK